MAISFKFYTGKTNPVFNSVYLSRGNMFNWVRKFYIIDFGCLNKKGKLNVFSVSNFLPYSFCQTVIHLAHHKYLIENHIMYVDVTI